MIHKHTERWTRERISRILELREILLSIQIGFSLVKAAVACAILESISGFGLKFAPLAIMSSENTDMDTMITTFNTAVTETASKVLGKRHHRKKKTGSLQKFLICGTIGES